MPEPQRKPRKKRKPLPWWRWPLRIGVSLLLAFAGWVFGNASRMLFVLAARNEAPEMLVRINRRGVPANAILFPSGLALIPRPCTLRLPP